VLARDVKEMDDVVCVMENADAVIKSRGDGRWGAVTTGIAGIVTIAEIGVRSHSRPQKNCRAIFSLSALHGTLMRTGERG